MRFITEWKLQNGGRDHFFITCTKSPRFNWKIHLTHREIGQNLDYSCAGQIFDEPFPPTGWIRVFERSRTLPILAESFLLETLEDVEAKAEVIRFNSAKETVFNETMEKLGLSYRFKWLFITPSVQSHVVTMLRSKDAPDPEWLDNHCIFLDGAFGRAFSTFQAKSHRYWPLLRLMAIFVQELKAAERVGDAYRLLSPDQEASIRVLYKEVREVVEGEEHLDPGSVVKLFEKRTQELLEDVCRQPALSRPPLTRPKIPRAVWKSIKGLQQSLSDEIMMALFFRWKLREPLKYTNIPYAVGSLANHLSF